MLDLSFLCFIDVQEPEPHTEGNRTATRWCPSDRMIEGCPCHLGQKATLARARDEPQTVALERFREHEAKPHATTAEVRWGLEAHAGAGHADVQGPSIVALKTSGGIEDF